MNQVFLACFGSDVDNSDGDGGCSGRCSGAVGVVGGEGGGSVGTCACERAADMSGGIARDADGCGGGVAGVVTGFVSGCVASLIPLSLCVEFPFCSWQLSISSFELLVFPLVMSLCSSCISVCATPLWAIPLRFRFLFLLLPQYLVTIVN